MLKKNYEEEKTNFVKEISRNGYHELKRQSEKLNDGFATTTSEICSDYTISNVRGLLLFREKYNDYKIFKNSNIL
jgi:hypothetical protein